MLIGPNYIYKCPNCGQHISVGSIFSGNTFGGKFYSDGKCISPMLPEFPDLTKCAKCNSFLWLHKMKEIGECYPGEETSSEWGNAQEAYFLTIDEYFEALGTRMAETREDETFIRKKIWQSYNDHIRYKKGIFIRIKDRKRWKANIRKLIKLLSPDDPEQQMMIAELYRNLGKFNQCKRTLKSINNLDMSDTKNKLFNACRIRNKRVIEI